MPYQIIKSKRDRIEDLRPFFKELYFNQGGVFGGYARFLASYDENPASFDDIDVYFQTKAGYKNFMLYIINSPHCEILECYPYSHRINYHINNKTYSINILKAQDNVSKIKGSTKTPILYGDALSIIKDLDFSVSRIVEMSPGVFLADEFFVRDEKSKTLRFYQINSLKVFFPRVFKYIFQKGYSIPVKELKKIFKRIVFKTEFFEVY